jgi:hypothetical protein
MEDILVESKERGGKEKGRKKQAWGVVRTFFLVVYSKSSYTRVVERIVGK